MNKYLITLLLVLGACDTGDDGNSAALLLLAGNQSLIGSIEQPADNTATMILGGPTYTIDQVYNCTDGTQGIIMDRSGAQNTPTLNIHNIDFTKSSGILLGPAGWVLDIDVPTGVYGPSQNCTAILHQNDAIYDLEVLNCPLDGAHSTNPNPATTTVSFRVRCVKD